VKASTNLGVQFANIHVFIYIQQASLNLQ